MRRTVDVHDADDRLVPPERRAHGGADAKRLHALGISESGINTRIGGEDGDALLHHAVDDRFTDGDRTFAVGRVAVLDDTRTQPAALVEEHDEPALRRDVLEQRSQYERLHVLRFRAEQCPGEVG